MDTSKQYWVYKGATTTCVWLRTKNAREETALEYNSMDIDRKIMDVGNKTINEYKKVHW